MYLIIFSNSQRSRLVIQAARFFHSLQLNTRDKEGRFNRQRASASRASFNASRPSYARLYDRQMFREWFCEVCVENDGIICDFSDVRRSRGGRQENDHLREAERGCWSVTGIFLNLKQKVTFRKLLLEFR